MGPPAVELSCPQGSPQKLVPLSCEYRLPPNPHSWEASLLFSLWIRLVRVSKGPSRSDCRPMRLTKPGQRPARRGVGWPHLAKRTDLRGSTLVPGHVSRTQHCSSSSHSWNLLASCLRGGQASRPSGAWLPTSGESSNLCVCFLQRGDGGGQTGRVPGAMCWGPGRGNASSVFSPQIPVCRDEARQLVLPVSGTR